MLGLAPAHTRPASPAPGLDSAGLIRVKRMRRLSSDTEAEAELRTKEAAGVADLHYYTASPLGGAQGWTQSDMEQSSIGEQRRHSVPHSSLSLITAGIPTSTYYTTASAQDTEPESPVKYHEAAPSSAAETGHDTFSDFVTLVCQEAGQGAGPRSPTKLVSYYSASMFPAAPTPPMARPVSGAKSPGREVRVSPGSSPDPLPRTILYTYGGPGAGAATIAIPESLAPANLSIVQPQQPKLSSAPGKAPGPASIRWTSSNGAFIGDIDSSSIAYDLMTPMISGPSEGGQPGATLHLADGRM